MFLHPLLHFLDSVERMKGAVARAHLSVKMRHGATDRLRGQVTGQRASSGTWCSDPWAQNVKWSSPFTIPREWTVVLANNKHENQASESRGC